MTLTKGLHRSFCIYDLEQKITGKKLNVNFGLAKNILQLLSLLYEMLFMGRCFKKCLRYFVNAYALDCIKSSSRTFYFDLASID